MDIITRTLNLFKEKRQRIINNQVNSIPHSFKRFSSEFIGIEQATYYLITGATKSAKTQFTSYVFIYTAILYSYRFPEKCKVNIHIYPLEESPEMIVTRFMSFLLYKLDNKRVDSKTLLSANNVILPEEIMQLLESNKYQDILQHFKQCVTFVNDSNPTGIYNTMRRYLDTVGTTTYKKQKVNDGLGGTKEVDVFDYYTLNDDKLFNLFIVDHISLLSTERGMSLKQSIDKLSEYCVLLRNRYKVSPVIIQQQSFSDTIDAYKLDKLTPSTTNLGDSKYTARDCTVALGIYNPFYYKIPNYLGYDISFFKDNIRFVQVLVNRHGQMGGVVPLFFDGTCANFEELPKPDDTTMYGIKERINMMRGKVHTVFALLNNKLKINKNG